MGSGVPVGAPPTVRTAIEPNLRASPIRTRHGCSYNQYPALRFNTRNRDLVLPVGAPPTVRTAIEPNLRTSPIRTRHGCSYNQYPALGFNARNGIWRTCRSTAHGANRNRTKPQSQPHSHPGRVLLQSISSVGVQCPEWDLVLPVGAPPTVRTAIEPNLKASPHSHPTRVLLQSISGVAVQYPGKGSGLTCRSTAHGANRNRTEPQSQPPFAPDTGAPTINIRR